MLGWILFFVASFVVLLAVTMVIVVYRLTQRVNDLEQALRTRPTTPPSGAMPPAPAPTPRPAAVRPEPVATSAASRTPALSSEQIVGGTWLQNAGSVLVLLGVFFLFLWGYSTGRFGPGVLVVAGVAFGALLVWRGDRTVPALPAFGHAVIGIGLGIAYLALYSGHFVLRVFGIAPAIGLLALAAAAAIAVGMRYRVQLISILGVIGAFVPWIAGFFTGAIPATGSAGALLGYLFAVDAMCFFLAARSGWSGLLFTANLLTTITWAMTQWSNPWSLADQVGLCALYLGLGLSLVPRIVAGNEANRPIDLAAVGIAPWTFAIASAPFLSDAPKATSMAILLGLAVAWGASAWLVDERRPRRDLWSQFVIAASAFVAAALERALGPTLTPLAWTVQGTTLLALGLVPRAGALRFSGYVLLALGSLLGLPRLVDEGWSSPLVTAHSIRVALSVLALLVAARLLERHRDVLAGEERRIVPAAGLAFAHCALAAWLNVHAARLAPSIVPGTWGLSSPVTLAAPALVALAWTTQGAFLFRAGLRAERAWTRVVGLSLLVFGGVVFFTAAIAFAFVDSSLPVSALHVVAVVLLLSVLPVLVTIDAAARHRARLGAAEFTFLKLVTVTTLVAGLLWSSLEAGVLARGLARGAGAVTLKVALSNAAWTSLAVVVFALGWFRGSPFLRWLGLGTLGLTIFRFLVVDLRRVDAFWRFLTAIAVGCVLLALSYVYQRARRARVAEETASAAD